MAESGLAAAPKATLGDEIVESIEGTPAFPRNSEGAFGLLHSGRIVYYFSQFVGDSDDNSSARIAEIDSDDEGRSWSKPRPVFPNDGVMNLMSVSLLRLQSGELGLFYLVKKSPVDCRPVLRFSGDEGTTWSAARPVTEAPGYFVLNNDRVIQTRSGRLIVPVAYHRVRRADSFASDAVDDRGIVLWYYSDDIGQTWKESADWWGLPVASANGLQEPGVVERSDGTLFSWARTDQGAQYGFSSGDGGSHWSAPKPTSLVSPCSPAAIKRLPGSSSLVAVYNDHSGQFPYPHSEPFSSKRTPLVIALSSDGGATWTNRKVLGDDPNCDYAYPAIFFLADAVLVADFEWDGSRGPRGTPLFRLRIRRINLAWLES